MKLFLALVLSGFLTYLPRQLQSAEAKYSGKAKVDGVGLIAFPPGEWSLESSRTQKSPDLDKQHREYFVFRRSDVAAERLTVVRYNPIIAEKKPSELMYYEDFRFGDGMPEEEKKGGDTGEIRVRKDEVRSDQDVESSFVTAYSKPRETWLCHTFLFCRNGWTLVLIHASTSVLDPNLLLEVEEKSKFKTPLPKGLFLIPPKFAGDWSGSADGDLTLIYLATDGKCMWSHGSLDVMSAAVAGHYDASEHTLYLNGHPYRVDEKALTMRPANGAKEYWASGVNQQFKKLPKEMPYSKMMVESLYDTKDGD